MVILCIDNDPEDIDFFREAVKEVDSSIIALSASSGQEALNLLGSFNPQELPAYVFLDINMPLMNGKETLEAIRKTSQYDSMQVVMLSTGLNAKDSAEYKDLGASHLMAKANSLREFCNNLTALFNNRAVH